MTGGDARKEPLLLCSKTAARAPSVDIVVDVFEVNVVGELKDLDR